MASTVTNSKTVLRRKKSSLSELRVTLLGDRDVGKSALVVRFITRRYIVDYDKGSDSKYKHEMIVDNDTVLYDILDSSSPITLNIKRFDFASHVTDLFLVMYSITDRQSFLYVRNLLKHLVLLKESGMPIPLIAIVGNKNDMAHLRQVSVEEGEILCTEYSELVVAFFGEISVADQLTTQLFADIYRWAKKQKVATKVVTSPTTTVGQTMLAAERTSVGSKTGSPVESTAGSNNTESNSTVQSNKQSNSSRPADK